MSQIVIYCDGACSGNPGPGGWGACIMVEDKISEIFGHQLNTTNNQMELMGAIKSLETLQPNSHVLIYTDSKYVQMGITTWIHNWVKNNWRTASNTQVKNSELWQRLLQLNQIHSIKWNWVKGHSVDKYNQLADRLAVKGRDLALSLT